jgi:hypothetical protein
MASLDNLPADQKAVLSLVLQRGRTFDQIAQLLSVDRAAVRRRALEGFDALGPETTLEPLKRALITDYLLGQLPAAVATNVVASLANSPTERAWARVIAAELAPLAVNGLPEIPAAATTAAQPVPEVAAPAVGAGAGAVPVTPDPQQPAPALTRAATGSATAGSAATGSAAAGSAAAGPPAAGTPGPGAPASSRRGGAILLGLIVLVIVVVVIILLATGGSTKKKSTPKRAQTPVTQTATTTAGTGTGTTSVKTLKKIVLISPKSIKGREGAAAVVQANSTTGLVLAAEGLPANQIKKGSTTNAYAVWLFNSKTEKGVLLGFYGKPVTATGKSKGELSATVQLPADASSYNELLVTIETAEKPTTPGTIVLEGSFTE